MREDIKIELRLLIDQINRFHEIYGENDIRASYLDGYFEILKTFFCAFYHLEEDDIMQKYFEIYQRDNFERKDILQQLQGQKNVLNSSLVINCWSNFELFITLFCNAVLSEIEIEELLELDYIRLKSILKNDNILQETDEKLKKCRKNHLAHSPMNNKFGKLLKKINPYPQNRDKSKDREFLEFFGKLRNCIHSNYIYYGGNDFKFTFNGETYNFNHGKLLNHVPNSEESIYYLTKELKEIFMLIVESLKYDNEIYDPSIELLIE